MNKVLLIFLLLLAIALIAYNVTLVDFQNPFEGNSIVALIGIVASLCAVVLLLIYVASKRIKDKMNED